MLNKKNEMGDGAERQCNLEQMGREVESKEKHGMATTTGSSWDLSECAQMKTGEKI